MPASRFIFGTLPWYSVLIVTGVCVALFIAGREEKRLGLPKDTVVDLALWIIPMGIVGARAYYVAFAWDTFRHNPVSMLYVWQGGLAIYGAVLGGLLSTVLFSRVRKLPLSRLTDMIAPGLLLAQAIGRWGNFFNMEAYGLPVTDPAWQFFPAAVLIPEAGGNTWHMATFFYESLWNALGVLVLLLGRKRMRRSGDASLWYFILYGSGRMVIEGLRTDSLMATDTLRVSQLLSAALCIGSIGVIAFRILKGLPRRQLVHNALGGAVITLLAALLPHPASFAGYEFACLAAVFLLQTAGASALQRTHSPRAAISIAAVMLCIVSRLLLSGSAMAPWAVSTLTAASLGVALLLGGASLYLTANNACAQESSTVS